jgi:hypothetical protein
LARKGVERRKIPKGAQILRKNGDRGRTEKKGSDGPTGKRKTEVPTSGGTEECVQHSM